MATARHLQPFRRVLWLAGGLGVGAASVHLASGWMVAAWLAPDLAVLVGARALLADGTLTPTAARAYNATHVLAGPALTLLVGATGGSATASAAGLIWLSHVAIDRGLGYGLKPVARHVNHPA